MAAGGVDDRKNPVADCYSFTDAEGFAIAGSFARLESNAFTKGHTGFEGNTRTIDFAGDEGGADPSQDENAVVRDRGSAA